MVEYIGTQVNVPGTRGKGILRYHGSIHGKKGIFAGIELLGPIALTRGKNNGDVEGYQYFNVQQSMSGLFLPFERLKSVNPQLQFTKDMINDIDHNVISLNNNVFNDGELTDHMLFSPTPSFTTLNSEQTNIPRPYSADLTKSRFNSPILHSASSSSTLNVIKRDERSRTSSISSFNKSPVLNSAFRSFSNNDSRLYKRSSGNNVSYLEQELYDLRTKYEKSEREMLEKMSILNDLRETVQDLQPILKQYENELNEKDKKISKIKNEFESAREDWRQNLDIMVNTYEANENFYESKIKELQLKLSENNSIDNSKINDLQVKYDELVNEKSDLELKFNSRIKELQSVKDNDTDEIEIVKSLNNKISDQQNEIETLSNQLVEISKFPKDEPKISENEFNELQSLVEKLIKENDDLKRDLERRHSFEKLEDKNTEINKLHDDIQHLNDKLNSKSKEIETLEDDLDMKVQQINELNSKLDNQIPTKEKDSEDESDKLKELQEDMFFKDQEIKALQQQLDKLNTNLATQKQTIKDLQAKNTQSVDSVNSVDSADSADFPDPEELSRLKTQNELLQAQYIEKDNIIKELERKLQESISNELDTLNINDAAAINEITFIKEIEIMKKELDSRPTIEELTELQDNIDEMVRLHNNEIFFKDEEMQKVLKENSKLQFRLDKILEGSITNRFSTASHESNSINSDLPIYKPEIDLDPSDGKDNWCGLCERDGHSSVNCPYENDIF